MLSICIHIPPFPFIHTWYLCFFLHRHNFLDKFFSTQKRVNCDKKFSTKQRKSPKSWFYNSLMRQNTINCTHNFSKLQIFFRFLMWRAFSTWQSVTWRIFPHDNLSCGEFFHMTTCYVEKFLHIADFFSTGTARGARDKYQVWARPDRVRSVLCHNQRMTCAGKFLIISLQKHLFSCLNSLPDLHLFEHHANWNFIRPRKNGGKILRLIIRWSVSSLGENICLSANPSFPQAAWNPRWLRCS